MDAGAPVYDPIRVEFIGGPWVRVLDPIAWRGPAPTTIPAGFESDGGTVPAIAWPVVGHPLSASVLIVYLLHDWDLQQGVAWSEARARMDSRLRALRVADARRVAIVSAVRLRGWLTGR